MGSGRAREVAGFMSRCLTPFYNDWALEVIHTRIRIGMLHYLLCFKVCGYRQPLRRDYNTHGLCDPRSEYA